MIKYLICGVAFATVMIAALPAAEGIGASTKRIPVTHVNRSAKGDRLAVPQAIAVKRLPVEDSRQQPPAERTDKRKIMDGCEPSFSPVTMPSMAHIAGRCVG